MDRVGRGNNSSTPELRARYKGSRRYYMGGNPLPKNKHMVIRGGWHIYYEDVGLVY